MSKELKFGTKEWSDISINILKGDCPNKCVVCYARANNKRYKAYDGELVLTNTFTNKIKKYADKVCMYPTTHDIFPEHLDKHIDFLTRSLELGNRFLIVTKGLSIPIISMGNALLKYQEQIEFRISIPNIPTKSVSMMEPNAPQVAERCTTLNELEKLGYNVSVSCEPTFATEIKYIEAFINMVRVFTINGDIWFGFINNAIARAKLNKQYDGDGKEAIDFIIKHQTPEFAVEIYNKYKDYDNIKFKESIMKHIISE